MFTLQDLDFFFFFFLRTSVISLTTVAGITMTKNDKHIPRIRWQRRLLGTKLVSMFVYDSSLLVCIIPCQKLISRTSSSYILSKHPFALHWTRKKKKRGGREVMTILSLAPPPPFFFVGPDSFFVDPVDRGTNDTLVDAKLSLRRPGRRSEARRWAKAIGET